MHTKSDSDLTSSVDPSSPRSPKRQLYYVQSPSRESHDGDKSSSMQATPAYSSPMESPSHPSYNRHSRASSASRFSGTLEKGRKRNEKGWTECNVIEEEGEYFYGKDKGLARRCQILMAVFGFLAVFSLFCLIIWGASRPYKAQIVVKSLTVHNFYFGEGADMTGVPSKMLTMNCSVRMTVHNPATFFGIHVSSNLVNLMYSEITVATVQEVLSAKKEPSNCVTLHGDKVPLYGAGASLAVSNDGSGVPMKLVFEVRSRGNVVGKLVKSRHRKRISCSLVIDSHSSKPLKLKNSSCQYD
ncbi:Plastidic type i signal peptidase 1 isoform 1 [Hibiscus syriacus]|uniref:Plastidic type i signal peptidase 1 isoform 1 n=1 Tax=Hibiscus syriacus TaxID=106335 RepID=A0A6A3CF26_HIBSY|nr:Plastidic type i signal peptidase 1 isoform 1 [Hibiscus syriacus]